MKATISWWSLDNSSQTLDSLRRYLRDEGVSPWESVPGMRSKTWISNKEHNLWGAIVIWEDADGMQQPLPPNRAKALIGYEPAVRLTFDVEVLVENQASEWPMQTASTA